MSRIRTIKPEFWSNAQIMECSPNARLLFIGLWNFADDAGRHPLSPKQIKALVFPSDNFSSETVQRMLDELSANDLITAYSVDGKEYFQINGWHHQRIDRPQSPKYPAPVAEHSSKTSRATSENSSSDHGLMRDKGKDKGKEKEFISSAEADFKRLREVYPKRPGDAPKPAFKAFTKAIRSINIEIIIAGAEAYAKSRSGQDPQYTKTLAAWLNAEMWDAEWGPKRNGSANGHNVELDPRLIAGHPNELIFDLGGGFAMPWRNLPNAIKNWREKKFWAPGPASPPFGSSGCKVPDEFLPEDLRQGARPP